MNKRGDTNWAVISIILAVLVLVILIIGFTLGWDKINPFVSRKNVDTVVSVCQTACATSSTYDYCNVQRKLVDAEKNKITSSCYVFANYEEFLKYNIENCDTITCSTGCTDLVINGKIGELGNPSGDYYDLTSLANDESSGQSCFINKA